MVSKSNELSIYVRNVLQLAWFELTQRYRRSLLGIWWSLITPISMVIIYYSVFRLVFSEAFESESEYFAYVVSGVIFLNLFIQVITGIGEAWAQKVNLVTRISISPHRLSLAILLANVFNFLILFSIMMLVLLFQENLKVNFIIFLVTFVSFLILIFSFAKILSIVYLLFDDIKALVRIGIMFLPYLTPVFYRIEFLPPKVASVVSLNPLTQYIQIFRYSLGISENDAVSDWRILVAISLIISLINLSVFNKLWKRALRYL
jgi:ABC-type polysaccharide/polyol phosphate export permease